MWHVLLLLLMADEAVFNLWGFGELLMAVQAPAHIHTDNGYVDAHMTNISVAALAVEMPFHHVDFMSEVYETRETVDPHPRNGSLLVPVIHYFLDQRRFRVD